MEKLQLRAPGRSLVVGWGGPQLCASLLARPAPHHAQLPPAAPMIQSAVELRESASKPKRCPSVAAPSGEQCRMPSGPPVGGPAVTAQGPRRLKPRAAPLTALGAARPPGPLGAPPPAAAGRPSFAPFSWGKGGGGQRGRGSPALSRSHPTAKGPTCQDPARPFHSRCRAGPTFGRVGRWPAPDSSLGRGKA